MTAATATASAAIELLQKKAVRARKMALHLADWAMEMPDEAMDCPKQEAEIREVLFALHDELEGLMERFGCDVIFEMHEEPATVTVAAEYFDPARHDVNPAACFGDDE